ncbi:MAG: serine/threonine protein kinase [Planctomycetota bacterium]|nr:MAG: serine/threonine protein kinase [Planctomycetota bacterium]
MTEGVLRFGEKLIELQLLTVDQVEQALQQQERARALGVDRSIGAWLHDRGLLDLVQIQNVLGQMGFPPAYCRVLPDIELSRLIGRGASGAVYQGWSFTLGEAVAVKVRAPKGSHSDPDARRFKQEAAITARINHPNVVRLFDAGETRDYVYHVFEYVEGRALDAILRERGKIPESELIDIGIQVCAGLQAAADEGIIHRDVKPANIMVSVSGRVKLCDLGLAKDTRFGESLTADGMVLGSPYYIAPEYAADGLLDARSDLYSLGVTLFHCAAGRVPFPGKSAMEILRRVVRDPTPRLQSFEPSVSDGFDTIIHRMMHKNPKRRYASARDAQRALIELRDTGRVSGGISSAILRGEIGNRVRAWWRRLRGAPS